MRVLGPDDLVPYRPRRVLVGGTSGSGKSTLAELIGNRLGVPYTEIDALYHGPAWTVRSGFEADVAELAVREHWVTEYQYAQARTVLLARCDLVVYLDLPRRVVMTRSVRRTVGRSLGRRQLWNGNVEPPLRTFFTDRDHIIRWAWRTHSHNADRLREIRSGRPDVPVFVLRTPREVAAWVAGPLTACADLGS